jgi:hypothetical protein
MLWINMVCILVLVGMACGLAFWLGRVYERVQGLRRELGL